MANFVAASRSNYFKVKDETIFRKAMEPFDVEIWSDERGFAVSPSSSSDDGCWPSFRTVRDENGNATDEEENVWFAEVVAEHLCDGEILVLQTIGAEKLRYLTGFATAMNNQREYVEVNIGDIYKLAEQKFGIVPTAAEY